MKIAVIDDYQDAFRKLACAARLQGHDIQVFRDTEKDPAKFAARLEGFEALIMTQQRSPLPKALVEKLPSSLKLLCNTGRNVGHI
ncbi:MAG: D-2-hydroxyacid dehydrogenase family protein, partial [Betaproteobacteria bacterium]|nr:D-2-hydroxyacid dehydrogenase family protein [Betaproteobacteria bacterium]